MAPKKHTVWTWHDDEGVVRHVGWGAYEDKHPAIERFESRFESDSQVDLWLQSYLEEPYRDTYGNDILSHAEAIGFAMGLRARHRKTVLKSRGPSTYNGGHPPRGVYRFCETDVSRCKAFASVRKAAVAMNCNPSTITRWCKDVKNEGWGYLDEVEGFDDE